MKRFTETLKWQDPWFRSLPPEMKLAWWYIIDTCDNAGVWKKDIELLEFSTGIKNFNEADFMLEANADKLRIDALNGNQTKWHVKDFVLFQYGNLSPNVPLHVNVMKLLESHRLTEGNVRVALASRKGQLSHKVKVKVKVDIVNKIVEYWNSKDTLPKIMVVTPKRRLGLACRCRSMHFTEKWEEAIDKMAASTFCQGKGNRGWKVTFDWFVLNDDNYVKALEGKYDDTPEDPLDKY